MKSKTNSVSLFKDKRILLLEGYCRQSLPFMKAYKDLGCEVSVLCDSKWDCAYWSRYADNKILGICTQDKLEETENFIIDLVKTGKYDVVIPLFDFSAEILAKNKTELLKYSNIAVNDKEAFDLAHDKLAVMHRCEEIELPHPQTLYDIDKPEQVRDSGIPFPIFIKPRSSAGAKGCHTYQSYNEFAAGIKENEIFLPNYVIQECLPIDSLIVSDTLVIDNDGNVKSSYQYGSYRFYPLSGGTGTLNITLNRADIHDISAKLVTDMNLKGLVSIDFMIDSRDNTPKVLEINPRIIACSKLGFVAGVNQAQQILEKELGQEVSKQMDYKSDVRVRMMQTDILWFLSSPDRFRVKPSWFSWKNTTEQMFSFSDPLPWFAFLFRGLKTLNNELKKRK